MTGKPGRPLKGQERIDSAFGILLKKYMGRKGITQDALAEAINVDTRIINKMIKGDISTQGSGSRRHIIALIEILYRQHTIATVSEANGLLQAARLKELDPSNEEEARLIKLLTPPHNLPAELNEFIGRELVIQQIKQKLTTPKLRLLTLHGIGGIGKTRIALQVAQELLADFPDGVFFVSLASLNDPGLLLTTLTQTIGLKPGGEIELKQSLTGYLRNKHLLLVLDNFERLIQAAPELIYLLQNTTWLKILVTSQKRLEVRGEYLYEVPPLEFLKYESNYSTSEEVAQNEACKLFIERTKEILPDFKLTKSNAHTIAAICQRLEGLPLAIELASALCDIFTPQELLTKLGSRMAILTRGTLDAPSRHQTLRTTFDWIYELLRHNEQQLLLQLSIFAGGYSLEALEAICELDNTQLLEALQGLIDASLLRKIQVGEVYRFVLLDTIREYAKEKIGPNDKFASVANRHSNYYLNLSKKIATVILNSQQWKELDDLEVEQDNFRAAFQHFLDHGAIDAAIELTTNLVDFWNIRGQWNEGQTWFKFILHNSNPVNDLIRAKMKAYSAWFAARTADYNHAERLCQECLVLYTEIDDKEGRAFVFNMLGSMQRFRGEMNVAEELLEKSFKIYQQLDHKRGMAEALVNRGWVMRFKREYEEAKNTLKYGEALYRELKDDWGLSIALSYLGVLARDQGNYIEATSLLEESLSLRYKINNKSLIASSYSNLGWVAWLRGDSEEAEELLKQSITMQRRLNDQWGLAFTLVQYGRIKKYQQKYLEALDALLESLNIRQELAAKEGIARCLEELAAIINEQNQVELAARLLGLSYKLRQNLKAYLPKSESVHYNQEMEKIQNKLGRTAFEQAWHFGQTLSLEDTISELRYVRRSLDRFRYSAL